MITMDSRIDDLEMTVATTNILKSHNVYFVQELILFTEKHLLSITNIGKNRLREIKIMLSRAGLSLSSGPEFNSALERSCKLAAPITGHPPLTFADVMGQQRDHMDEANRLRKEELRDKFAGLAMLGLTVRLSESTSADTIAGWAYQQADAMLRAREAGQ